jgi:hypothetical protein
VYGILEVDGVGDLLSLNSTNNTAPVQFNAYNNVDFRIIQRSNGIMTLWTSTIERMRINQSGDVGIGTTTPTAKLHIATTNDVSPNNIGTTGYDTRHLAIGSSGANESALAFSKNATSGGSGYITSATIGLSWDPIGFQAGIYNWYLGGATTPSMVLIANGNLLIGKATQTNSAYKLDVAGEVRANQVVVNTTGADFVFDSSYRLRPLSDIKEYIALNHHLPDIASANQMQSEGLRLGDNQMQLLQKIEELTLYAISSDQHAQEEAKIIAQQQELLSQLGSQLKVMQSEIEELKKER